MKKIIVVMVMFLMGGMSVTQDLSAERPRWPFKSIDSFKDAQRYLELRGRLFNKVSPEEKRKILFAFAEYYFRNRDYQDGRRAFEQVAQGRTADLNSLLANVFLYKMAVLNGKKEEVETYKKRIFNQNFVLLFDQYKELRYTSLFDNEYTIHYFVDRIEVFLNGEIFEEIGS